MTTKSLIEEVYRVVTRYRVAPGRVATTVRQEGPWSSLEDAETFAAKFTPPKFIEAWVEGRIVSHWGRVTS